MAVMEMLRELCQFLQVRQIIFEKIQNSHFVDNSFLYKMLFLD